MFNKVKLIYFSIYFVGIFMISESYAKSYKKNCFSEHILESIHINKERKKYYAKLTDDKSDRIFNLLIGYEYLTLVPAKYFDILARPFHKKKMDLFCHEFMSMNEAPDFDPNYRIYPTHDFYEFPWKYYKKEISKAIKADDIEKVRKLSLWAIIELSDMPQYYCMTRHLMESVYRFAHFIPIREKEAKELGIKSPRKIMKNVISAHLLGFRDTYKIDQWSQPIQKEGIPLLCSELPNLLFDLDNPELDILKKGES